MRAPDLIFELRNAGYSIKAEGAYLNISPADNLPPNLLEQLKQHKPEILVELQRERQSEARRERVLEMLDASPQTETHVSHRHR